MTGDQFTELVDFLGRKFEGIDRRFEGIDRKFEAVDRQFDEVRRHADVLFEQGRDELRTVAEGLNARIDVLAQHSESRFTALERGLSSLDDAVRRTLADHETRIRALE